MLLCSGIISYNLINDNLLSSNVGFVLINLCFEARNGGGVSIGSSGKSGDSGGVCFNNWHIIGHNIAD